MQLKRIEKEITMSAYLKGRKLEIQLFFQLSMTVQKITPNTEAYNKNDLIILIKSCLEI